MTSYFTFTDWINSDTARALCLTLLHSLWQGLICALMAAVMLSLTKDKRPALRYRALLAVFALFIFAAVSTFMVEQKRQSGVSALTLLPNPAKVPPGDQVNIHGALSTSQELSTKLSAWLSENSILIIFLWAIVIFLRLVLLSFSLGYTSYIQRYHTSQPHSDWLNKVNEWSNDLGIPRAITLLESARIRVPVVYGYFKPVIFVPLGMLVSLPVEQAEAILLHELAHIRRHDYLVNIMQHIVETLFFFNPALRWLSAVIRDEREHCCDDIAIRKTKDPKAFVAALVSFREYLSSPALSVTFPGRNGTLVARAFRIVHGRNHSLKATEKSWLMLGCLTAIALFLFFNKPLAGKAQIAVQTSSHIRQFKSADQPIPLKRKSDTTQKLMAPATATDIELYKRKKNHSLKDSSAQTTKALTFDHADADVNADKQRTRNIITALVRERVVNDATALSWFGLDAGQLVVNGQKQPEALHQQLKKEFQIEEGHGLYYGPVQVTGTGSFFDEKDLR